MKYKVTITFEVDPTEYNEAVDTEEGIFDLVKDMFQGKADLSAGEYHMVVQGISGNTLKKGKTRSFNSHGD